MAWLRNEPLDLTWGAAEGPQGERWAEAPALGRSPHRLAEPSAGGITLGGRRQCLQRAWGSSSSH